MNKLENTLDEIKSMLVNGNHQGNGASELTHVEKVKIENILKDFDFEKIHKVMELLDWKWLCHGSTGHMLGVPTIEELKTEAKRLLVEAAVEETNIATGGFRAVYEKNGIGDPDPYIALEFIVEDCEGFEDEDEDEDEDDENPIDE